MQEDAFAVQLVAGLLFLPAAVHLLRVAARTGKLPERLLGWNFALVGIAYLLYEAPSALQLPEPWTPWYLVGRVVFGAGCLLMAVFAQRVFRPGVRWAQALLFACIALVVGGIAVACLTGDPDGFSLANPGFWIESAGLNIPYLWLGSEAFLHYARARKRQRIGLTPPLECHRFLLWGIFAVFELCASCAALVQYRAYAEVGYVSGAMDLLLGGSEIVTVAVATLAVSTPAAYRRWVERSAPAALPAEEG